MSDFDLRMKLVVHGLVGVIGNSSLDDHRTDEGLRDTRACLAGTHGGSLRLLNELVHLACLSNPRGKISSFAQKYIDDAMQLLAGNNDRGVN